MSLTVTPLDSLAQVQRAAQVLDEVWGGDPDRLSASLLRALAHSGNYVVGVYDGDAMVGVSVAFFEAPVPGSASAPGGEGGDALHSHLTLHSHITGILPGQQGKGAGRLIKAHQRDWALARGIEAITWTYDPLLARNARFNLGVLGATVTEYLTDFYGPMADGLNQGEPSDRLSVSWHLPEVAAGPVREVSAVVEIPADIEALRRTDPSLARQWRLRVREEFTGQLAAGRTVAGFEVGRGYLFADSGSAEQ